ncbi:hypothetical protein VHEMI05879 [[Torrubiella] hemipterigena]|uniref:Serine peptidase n=1 Tax=[Torrubiella] hemipterigena TaxID=1531966 RepID=A0A0A1SZ23_9HYPO|nr:hypothetical protein VHEMI05879 [[Torrubiella] hemipterigena]
MRLLLLAAALAFTANAYHRPSSPARDAFRAADPGNTTQGLGTLGHFDQLIDHSNPSLGTFKQRYWWNIDHYGGPHSPIMLESPGEFPKPYGQIDGMDNHTLPGLLAQDNAAAYITIEHRYYGDSMPFGNKTLNAETLQQMTLDNAIQDLVYFAKNVVFPFDKTNGTATKPDQAPWLLAGCSYAGALAAWTQALAPGTFWAYEAGSAVVETREQFWEYYVPIKNAMPPNCSADFQRVVKHVDDVLLHGTETYKAALKRRFSADGASDQDFVTGFVLGPLSAQQNQQVSSKTSALTFLCDYLENQQPEHYVPMPGSDGVGLDRALDGFQRLYGGHPPGDNLTSSSLDSRVKELLPSTEFIARYRNPFDWMLCNEPFEWWQSWSRLDTTGFLSKLWTWQDDIASRCEGQYPDTNGFQYGLKKGHTYHEVNKRTGGWRNVNTTRLVWINGEFDPWKAATVSWDGRPGGALQSTPEVPVYVFKNAGHCNDYITANADTVEGKHIFDATRGHFRQWVAEFYKEHPHAAL